MIQQVKMPAAEPEDPSLIIPRTHMIRGEEPISASCPLTCMWCRCAQAYKHTNTNVMFKTF